MNITTGSDKTTCKHYDFSSLYNSRSTLVDDNLNFFKIEIELLKILQKIDDSFSKKIKKIISIECSLIFFSN